MSDLSEGELPEAALDTRKHAKFDKPLRDYCATYGVETDRTIKYWVATGKKVGRLPPLDQPEKMAAWWAFAMVTRVPDRILTFTKKDQAQAGEVVSTAASASGRDSAPPPNPRDFSKIATMDLQAHVEKLRHNLAIDQAELETARAGGDTDTNTITLAQRRYSDTFELLRKAEQTLIAVQKERGEVIERENVAIEISQAAEMLALMRSNMPAKIIVDLEKNLPRRLSRILKALTPFLTASIENVRASEEQILRELSLVRGPEQASA